MTSEAKQHKDELDDAPGGVLGNKDMLRSFMDKAKKEYLETHKDLVNAYLSTHPNANTVDILNHIQIATASERDEGGVSLNCLFILCIALLIVVVLRTQYNFYVEQLLISSLFFSLNPSIDIKLLLNDLPLNINKCKAPHYWMKHNDNKQWMQHNMEYCNFVRMSINRKLLYIYEYSSHSFKQNSDDLHTFMEWIFNERFNTNTHNDNYDIDIQLMPWSDIRNKDDFKRFIVLNIENIQNKWNVYMDKMEKMYAKKSGVEVDDVLYRLGIEMTHYLMIHSLYDLNDDNVILSDTQLQINKDIVSAVEGYLKYEYFRDGFVCILSKKDHNHNEHRFIVDFVTINELMNNEIEIKYYLNVIKQKEMICIHTFESMGRLQNEIKIYLNIIEESLNHWDTMQITNVFIVDKYKEIKDKLSLEFGVDKADLKPYWNEYKWLKGNRNGISMKSLMTHDEMIYSQNYVSFPIEKDIKYYMKQFEKQYDSNSSSLLYSNNYLFHQYFFDQFQTKDLNAQHWSTSEMTQFMGVINKQFGSVSILTQKIVEFIDSNYVYYDAGFLWILCDNNNENNTLYFEYSLRYNAPNHSILSSNDAVIMMFDLWSHSYYHDFIKGNAAKRAQYERGNKDKFKAKETIGQSIDVNHIGTSLQNTFNYARTKMEVFGYYINSLFQNLDWIKVAKRWQTQCNKKRSAYKSQQTQTLDTNSEPNNDPSIYEHQDL